MADWSELPFDIVGHILLKLDDVEDFVCCSAVCRSWNIAYSDVKQTRRRIYSNNTLPWLMLPEVTHDNPDCFRDVISLASNRRFRLKLPETFGRRCWGLSDGWLLTLSLDLELHLFNPLTKTRLPLPHASTLPDSKIFKLDVEYIRLHLIRNCALLYINNKEDDLAIVIAAHNDDFAFARPYDTAWTLIEHPFRYASGGCGWNDVSCWEGKVYVLGRDLAIRCCDVSCGTSNWIDCFPQPRDTIGESMSLYLVNSFGELLMVDRIWEAENIQSPYYTNYLKVYRPNLQKKEWEEIFDMGEISLFVGNNTSMAVHVPKIHDSKYNRVYFTDNAFWDWMFCPNFGGQDMGYVGLKDDKFSSFYEGDDIHSAFCTSLFFIPVV